MVELSQFVRLSLCYSCTKCALLSQVVVAYTLASCHDRLTQSQQPTVQQQ